MFIYQDSQICTYEVLHNIKLVLTDVLHLHYTGQFQNKANYVSLNSLKDA